MIQGDNHPLLSLVDDGDATCDQVRRMTLHHAEEINGKLTDLRRMRKVLLSMAAECDGGAVPDCPILEALFESEDR